MARIAGYIRFGNLKTETGLIERMATSFNLRSAGTATFSIDLKDGSPVFGLALAEVGSTADELRQRIIPVGKGVCLFDGTADAHGNISLLDMGRSERDRFLASQWEKNPMVFPTEIRGPVQGLFFHPDTMSLTYFRDRFAAKTLYYYRDSRIVLFASEIKAILASRLRPFAVNEHMLGRFLSMNYRMWFGREETFFRDILELPVASYLTVDPKGIKIDRYWAPPDRTMSSSAPDEEYVARYTSLLDASLRRSLARSKKRLFFVSGGLDAPVIAARASGLLEERVDCLAAVFPDEPDFDESRYIESLTEKIGAKKTIYRMTQEDFVSVFNTILQRHDQPLLSATYVLFHQLLSIAADGGYDSVFGGGGGDIVSQGCLEYQPYLLADYYHMGVGAFDREIESWCSRVGPYLRYWPGQPQLLRDLIGQLVDLNVRGRIRNNPDWVAVDRTVFGPALKDVEVAEPTVDSQYFTYRQSRLAEELFHQAIPTHFVEDINGASFPIKGFDPFWDLDLIEFGLTLPLKMLQRDGWTKYIVRKAAEGILPEIIRWRPDKTGLGLPIDSWFREGPLCEGLREVLESDVFGQNTYLDTATIRQAFNDHVAQRRAMGGLLWKVFAFSKWEERWLRDNH